MLFAIVTRIMCKVLSITQKFPDLFYYIYIFILISRFNLIKFGENFEHERVDFVWNSYQIYYFWNGK